MTRYTAEQTPVLSNLARSYAVCDEWFASVPSQTLPNRDFVHTATSMGNVNNKPNILCDSLAIYNQIQTAIDGGRDDLSWAVYSGTQKERDAEKWDPFSLTRLCMTQIQDKKFDPNFKMMKDFYADAKAGTLSSYSFLEPQFSGSLQNDQHPPADTLSKPRSDAPAVTPDDYPDSAEVLVNDLHHLAAEILAERLGVEKPDEADLHDFIHKAYVKSFGS